MFTGTIKYKNGLVVEVISEQTFVQNIFCTREKLEMVFPKATKDDLDEFYDLFNKYARRARIDDLTHENFFLAQVLAEVGGGLEGVRENLNYSCEALRSTFSYYRDRPDEASEDGRCGEHEANQEAIANKAYGNRLGNGSVSSGDGYCFRGGGYFQLTGRTNYQMVVDGIKIITNKDYSAEDYAEVITNTDAGMLGALAFWFANSCYECEHIDCVTAKINKHTDTYDKRKELYQWIAGL
jgi:putative chitinase